jgi:hypothetical protein
LFFVEKSKTVNFRLTRIYPNSLLVLLIVFEFRDLPLKIRSFVMAAGSSTPILSGSPTPILYFATGDSSSFQNVD